MPTAAASACRSTSRTACTARPATSRTRRRTSCGSRPRAAAVRTTSTCSVVGHSTRTAMRIGLAASRLHRAPGAALWQWLAACGDALARELAVELCVVGQTHDDVVADGGFPAGVRVRRLPPRREGGLIRLVAGVVDDSGPDALDAVVYLLDPEDPTSQFPEALALKREC